MEDDTSSRGLSGVWTMTRYRAPSPWGRDLVIKNWFKIKPNYFNGYCFSLSSVPGFTVDHIIHKSQQLVNLVLVYIFSISIVLGIRCVYFLVFYF